MTDLPLANPELHEEARLRAIAEYERDKLRLQQARTADDIACLVFCLESSIGNLAELARDPRYENILAKEANCIREAAAELRRVADQIEK